MTDQTSGPADPTADKSDLARATTALYAVDQRMSDIVRTQRRSKTQITVLAVSVVFDIILSIGLFVSIHRTDQAQRKIEANTTSLYAGCLRGNEFRKDQSQLWDNLFKLSPPPKTAEEKKRTAEARALIDRTYAQRVCVKGR